MTKTAVLFIDSKVMLDGVTLAATSITDVALVKRILIDLRRAGIENIFAIADERTEELEAIFDDTRRTDFKRLVFDDGTWREELLRTGDSRALVLTADRLSDHRFLQNLASARSTPGRVVISIDLKKTGEDSPTEKGYLPNDGRLIARADLDGLASTRDVGIYELPVSMIAKFEKFDPKYICHRAEEHINKDTADYFDIGNGFVEVIDSKQAIKRAEQRLIRYIWKSTDGVHGRMNKRIVLPLLKLLLRTPVTPNMISLLGVIVSVISGYFYWRGAYKFAIVGGLLAVASSLLDHIDGSIARIKSKESAFGAHFDTICDYVFYVAFAIGASMGLYKSMSSPAYLWMGFAILFGTVLSLLMTSYKRTSFASNASLYAAEAHKRLDTTGRQKPIVRLGRKIYFVARRPALPYYLLIFTIIGLLPFVVFMMALGTNLFWMFHVYTHKLLSPQPRPDLSKK